MNVFLTIKNYRCFVSPVTIEVIDGFTSFVGVNNAGKSSIMRFLLEFRHMFGVIGRNGNFFNTINRANAEVFSANHVSDQQEIFSNLNEHPIIISINFKYNEGEKKYVDYLENKINISPSKVVFTLDRNMRFVTDFFVDDNNVETIRKSLDFDEDILKINNRPSVDCSYLFKLVKSFSSTLYVGAFRNTINIGSNDDYFDMRIGEAFIKHFDQLKTGDNKKDNLAISELTSSIAKIFEFSSLEINPSSDRKTLHINVNGKPYKQHELGSGLLQFILVIANASIRRPAYILIDEPELNLHPRLQLDFLTTLGSYASNGVWFATHSIGLARSASEQVYSVTKIEDGNSTIKLLESTPRLAEFLGEMSFSSHKELGFDKILLVEGPTDVSVFQQFLRKLNKDHKVVLLPLYGQINGNAAMALQLDEIQRITSNIFAIVDSEKVSEQSDLPTERQNFLDLCNSKGIGCHILKYRAIENYFSQDLVGQVFGNEYNGLSTFERPDKSSKFWGKGGNYKLAKYMSEADFKNVDFYQFLEKL